MWTERKCIYPSMPMPQYIILVVYHSDRACLCVCTANMVADPCVCHSMASVTVVPSHLSVDAQAVCGMIRLQQSVAKVMVYAVVQPDETTINYLTLRHEATSRSMRGQAPPLPG